MSDNTDNDCQEATKFFDKNGWYREMVDAIKRCRDGKKYHITFEDDNKGDSDKEDLIHHAREALIEVKSV